MLNVSDIMATPRGGLASRPLGHQLAGAVRLPPNNRMIWHGDSRAGLIRLLTGTLSAYAINSVPAWTRFFSAGRISTGFNDFYAIGGARTDAILATTEAMLQANDAGIVAIFCSTNDRAVAPVLTAQQSIDNLTAMRDLCFKYGRYVIFIAETPRGDTKYTAQRLSGTQLKYHMRVHEWLLRQKSVPGVSVIDPWPVMADASSANGDAVLLTTYDGLHPSKTGGAYVGQLIADEIARLLPAARASVSSNADIYDQTLHPDGCLNPNPMLAGSGGALTAGTGNIASSWTNEGASGVTLVYSKETINGEEWQKIVVSGTTTGTQIFGVMKQAVTLEAGAVYDLTGQVQVDAGVTGLDSISLQLYDQASGFTWGDMYATTDSDGGDFYPAIATKGVQRPPAATAIAADNRVYLRLRTRANVAISATIRIRGVALRRTA